MFEDKKILLGVTGGVAIYKVLEFVSSLKKQGVQFKIIMTESAKQMIRPVLFETIGNCEVYDEMFEKKKEFSVEHIGLSRWADAFLIAPATANTIAKINAGFADNLLTATALAYDGSIIFAQTMNENMLNNEITMKNIESLKKRGHKFIHSSYGHLACNAFGQGRMAEPSEIEDFMKCHFIDKDLKGKRVIITGGPTREKLDPVRFITNYSSGKMGLELAKAARNRGCITTFISGPICMEVPKNIEHILVESTEEMSNEVLMRFPEADVLIMFARFDQLADTGGTDHHAVRRHGIHPLYAKSPCFTQGPQQFVITLSPLSESVVMTDDQFPRVQVFHQYPAHKFLGRHLGQRVIEFEAEQIFDAKVGDELGALFI